MFKDPTVRGSVAWPSASMIVMSWPSIEKLKLSKSSQLTTNCYITTEDLRWETAGADDAEAMSVRTGKDKAVLRIGHGALSLILAAHESQQDYRQWYFQTSDQVH